MVGRGGRLLLVALAVGALAASAAPAPGRSHPALPRVTLIGDSVADAFEYDATARTILGQGVDLNLQVAPCRRLGGDSCPYEGVRPQNVVQLVHSLGSSLGATVIVAVGYNDFQKEYAADIEDALGALKEAGVTHVLWPTLRAAEHPYLTMNDDIRAAAERHPEMTIVDWNLYSRSHPDWFQADGVHLAGYGVRAMATLFHKALLELDVPVLPPVQIVTARLPDAREGKRYSATLRAQGGEPPYRWSPAAPLPGGLRLAPGGRLAGMTPARPGVFRISVRVADASGRSATRRIPLRVRP